MHVFNIYIHKPSALALFSLFLDYLELQLICSTVIHWLSSTDSQGYTPWVLHFFHRSSQGAEGHFQGLCLSKAFEGQTQVVCGAASCSEIMFFQNWYLLIWKQYPGCGDNGFCPWEQAGWPFHSWMVGLGHSLPTKEAASNQRPTPYIRRPGNSGRAKLVLSRT